MQILDRFFVKTMSNMTVLLYVIISQSLHLISVDTLIEIAHFTQREYLTLCLYIRAGLFRSDITTEIILSTISYPIRFEFYIAFRGDGLAQRKAYINGKIIACSIWAVLL